MKTVGILLTSPEADLKAEYIEPFKKALSKLMQPSEVRFIVHAPSEHLAAADKMREHAAGLLAQKPDAIWLNSTATAIAALEARAAAGADSIPVVVSALSSVERNRAQSTPNFTGVVNRGWELGGTRFGLLREIMPTLSVVGVLVNPDNGSSMQDLEAIKAAAAKDKVTVEYAEVRDHDGVENALKQLRDKKAQAVMTTHIPLFQNCRNAILRHAETLDMPVVGHRSYFATEGALLSYGSVLAKQIEQSAQIVCDALNKGRADGPLENPTDFEAVVNTTTAATFKLAVPQGLKTVVPSEVRLVS